MPLSWRLNDDVAVLVEKRRHELLRAAGVVCAKAQRQDEARVMRTDGRSPGAHPGTGWGDSRGTRPNRP